MFDNGTAMLARTALLDQWNIDLRTTLMPIIILLLIYLLIGTCGNTIVIYIYKFRFREYNEDRYFIPVLAMVDLFASVVCPTGEIISYFNPVKYTNCVVCKFFQTMEHFASGYSAILLTVVAINRYRAICRPLKPRFTIRTRRAMLLGTFVFVACLVIPSVVTNGIKMVDHTALNVTGSRCTTITVRGSSTFPLAYNILLMTACVSNLVVLCVLYTLVIRALFQQARNRTSQMLASVTVISSSSACQRNESRQNHRNSITSSGQMSLDTLKLAANRLTVMFCIVTSVYVICFIPTLIVMVLISLDNSWLTKSQSQIAGLRFVRNMFMINNIVNPIIYGIFDKKIRDEIIKIVKGRIKCHFNQNT
ncbi:growth hormone secretagogue receptor type 1-like [Mizuhopecten yessoensis]|uniref:Orexin receptor type 2 n=1 Tax=Mizuhopecten yessoensis TaxID=6573 RepID=A0A210QB98_MIZYE|nr:growth hormone secretagogue receptor type 1-like [Mizuhopecten yessoensis]OWF46008.1 Orexin receptor type 2 [Mizuhopecten yessoensis]